MRTGLSFSVVRLSLSGVRRQHGWTCTCRPLGWRALTAAAALSGARLALLFVASHPLVSGCMMIVSLQLSETQFASRFLPTRHSVCRKKKEKNAVLGSPGGPGVRKIAAHQITPSDLNTFTNTFLINMRMKFVMTATTKSDAELMSLKEMFGLCEGRAEQRYCIPVRATRYTCVLAW